MFIQQFYLLILKYLLLKYTSGLKLMKPWKLSFIGWLTKQFYRSIIVIAVNLSDPTE